MGNSEDLDTHNQATDGVRNYWMEQLSKVRFSSDLVLDYPRSDGPSFDKSTIGINLAPETVEKLSGIGDKSACSIYCALLATLKICLHKYSGERVIAVGSPSLAGADGNAGNVLVTADEISGCLSFDEILDNMSETLKEVYSHQGYPYTALLKDMSLEGIKGRFPLFNTALVYTSLHEKMPEVGAGGRSDTAAGQRYDP